MDINKQRRERDRLLRTLISLTDLILKEKKTVKDHLELRRKLNMCIIQCKYVRKHGFERDEE